MRSRTITEALLWIAIGVNGFMASNVAHLVWNKIHRIHNLHESFEVAMRIVAISGPISVLCAVGLAVWAVLRFTVPRAAGYTMERALVILVSVNIVAPLLLWYGAVWTMR